MEGSRTLEASIELSRALLTVGRSWKSSWNLAIVLEQRRKIGIVKGEEVWEGGEKRKKKKTKKKKKKNVDTGNAVITLRT